jgi:hypothetical protein
LAGINRANGVIAIYIPVFGVVCKICGYCKNRRGTAVIAIYTHPCRMVYFHENFNTWKLMGLA